MNGKIKRIALDGVLLAILIVASKISIPIFATCISLQLLAMLLICKLTKTIDGLLIVATYIVAGLIGIPVFASATAGLGIFLSPTFGFIIGFMAMILGDYLLQKTIFKEQVLISTLFLVLIDYIFGYIYVILIVKVWGIYQLDLSAFQILMQFIVVFIPFDVLKCVIATKIIKIIDSTV